MNWYGDQKMCEIDWSSKTERELDVPHFEFCSIRVCVSDQANEDEICVDETRFK